MNARFPENQAEVVDVESLPRDIRRMLTVQLKEFIHTIEDRQIEQDLSGNLQVIGYLERCYEDAA